MRTEPNYHTVKPSMNEQSEDDMPASPDEKSMAMKQADFIMYVGKEVSDHLKKNKEFPEWMQNKLSALHQKSKDLHSSLGGHGMDEQVNEISDKMRDRYIQKAVGDHQHANAVRKDAESRGDKNLAVKMRDRMKKRNKGMSRAFGGERD
jgi:hypothetical protein